MKPVWWSADSTPFGHQAPPQDYAAAAAADDTWIPEIDVSPITYIFIVWCLKRINLIKCQGRRFQFIVIILSTIIMASTNDSTIKLLHCICLANHLPTDLLFFRWWSRGCFITRVILLRKQCLHTLGEIHCRQNIIVTVVNRITLLIHCIVETRLYNNTKSMCRGIEYSWEYHVNSARCSSSF